MDKEQKIRLQFLDEAQQYLNVLEGGFLGSASRGISTEQMNALLRAAHSIKGGAAVMGFGILSDFAHRLEDGLKVLRTPRGKALLDDALERLLLQSVDRLQEITQTYVRQEIPSSLWLDETIAPAFTALHDRLGDPSTEDEAQLISEESGVNVALLMFETEVEGCLAQLETLMQSGHPREYAAAFIGAAEQLEPLGYMLDLLPFSSLCQDIAQHFSQAVSQTGSQAESQTESGADLEHLAIVSLSTWRRCQALVLVDQTSAIPDKLDLTIDLKPAPIAPPLDHSAPEILDPQPLPESLPQVAVSLDAPQTVQPISEPIIAAQQALQTQQSKLKTENSKRLPPEHTLRVSSQHLDRFSELLGELVTQRSGLNLSLQDCRDLMRNLKQRVRTLEQANRQLRSAYDRTQLREGSRGQGIGSRGQVQFFNVDPLLTTLSTQSTQWSGFDSLELDQYGELHLLLQDLMETIVQVQEVSEDLETVLQTTEAQNRALGRTTKHLQGNLNQFRMRPLADLVDRFPRAIREMSLTYHKPVDLKLRGRSTLVEQSILEALNDPLLHLVRNAFDHGIEPPEQRRAKGKPETGRIELSATHKGNYTFITLRDDGAGIDLEKVKAKALKMGISADEVAEASEADLLDLLFEPGFSTAAQVTDLSGRGVGLDVVRNNLSQIQGEIQIQTEPDRGTTFILKVPFSLSIGRVLVVESNGITIAFPANAVEEIILIPTPEGQSSQGSEPSQGLEQRTQSEPSEAVEQPAPPAVTWMEQDLAIVPLRNWFSLHPSLPQQNRSESLILQRPIINQPVALVVKHRDTYYALGVDRYWREQEVSLQPVAGQLPLPAGFSSCAILSDGHIAPVLDPGSFLEWTERQDLGFRHASPTAPQSLSSLPIVLVVDDSINVRQFLAVTLEKAGYRVKQAKDGQDALEQLQSQVSQASGSQDAQSFGVQAIVSDLEMPRLDGFGLLAQLKSSPNHRDIPVILLTSRSGEKHRRLASQLGAAAYLTKPYQEQDLLATLEQCLGAR